MTLTNQATSKNTVPFLVLWSFCAPQCLTKPLTTLSNQQDPNKPFHFFSINKYKDIQQPGTADNELLLTLHTTNWLKSWTCVPATPHSREWSLPQQFALISSCVRLFPPTSPARWAHARLSLWTEMTRGLRVLPAFTPAALQTSCSGGATSHNKPDCLPGGRAKETFPRFPQFLLHYKPGRVCVAWFNGRKKKKTQHRATEIGDKHIIGRGGFLRSVKP